MHFNGGILTHFSTYWIYSVKIKLLLSQQKKLAFNFRILIKKKNVNQKLTQKIKIIKKIGEIFVR